MNKYELTVLLKDDLASIHGTILAEITSKVAECGGRVIKVENEGSKRLAYPIREQERATYVFMEVELADGAPVKLSQWLNIYDPVLRYLLVREF